MIRRAWRVIIFRSPFISVRLLQCSYFVFVRQNHKAAPDCPPRPAFAPADQAQIAGLDRPDRLRRPRGSRSDAENPCPTAHVLARLRPGRARLELLPY